MSVSDARLNGLIRIELVNDFSDIIEQNPVLYVRTWEEVSQALHQPKAEPQTELEEADQELNLFHFWKRSQFRVLDYWNPMVLKRSKRY